MRQDTQANLDLNTDELQDACDVAITDREFKTAHRFAQRSLLADPGKSRSYIQIAQACIQIDQNGKAADALSHALVFNINSSIQLQLNHALSSEAAGRYEAALGSYNSVLREDPANKIAREHRIAVTFLMGDRLNSLQYLSELPNRAFDQNYMLGVCELELGRPDQALAHLAVATSQRPNYQAAIEAQAEALFLSNRLDQALLALRSIPSDIGLSPRGEYTLGRIYNNRDQTEVAERHLRNACRRQPKSVEFSLEQGRFYVAQNRRRAALPYLEHSHRERPDDYQISEEFVTSLIESHKVDEAKSVVADILDRNPDNASIWNAMSIHVKSTKDREAAIIHFRRGVEKYPDEPILSYNLAHTLNELSRAEEGKVLLRRALVLNPAYAKAYSALSVSHLIMLDLAGAVTHVDRAIYINPILESAWINKAIAHRASMDFQDAVTALRRALELNPDDPNAHTNLAYTLLMAGEIEQGFNQYDNRWKNPEFPSSRRPFRQQIWRGENPGNKRILLYMEQGMGDEIMFAWYFNKALSLAKNITVECDPRLIPIFKRSFPTIEFIPRQDEAHLATRDPEIIYKAPIGHIPKFFWHDLRRHINKVGSTALRPIARTEAYLKTDNEHRKKWRRYLDEVGGTRIKVGVCWRSSIHSRARDRQYLTAEEIVQPFDPRFAVFNIQYDHMLDETEDLTRVCAENGVVFDTPPDLDLRNDLDELTALTQELDLVVTPLISTAFMAGAVGTPTWVFRSSEYSCIWQMFGTDFVPWFPSMRLFFRDPRDPWSSTIESLKAELSKVANDYSSEFRSQS